MTPVIQVEVAGLTEADQGRDAEFDSLFARTTGDGRICAGGR